MRKAFFLFLSMLVALSTYSFDIQMNSKKDLTAKRLHPDLKANVSFYSELLRYTINSDGISVRVAQQNLESGRGISSSTLKGDLTIPESVTYEGKKYAVTAIGDSAFHYCSMLKSVIIPSCVKSIGAFAFSSCQSINKMYIPAHITSFGKAAFAHNNISEFTVAEDHPTFCVIDGFLFSKDKKTLLAYPQAKRLQNYVIPSFVKTIGVSAFHGNSPMSVVIPEGVTSIEESAFQVSGISSITIPSSVTSIGKEAFLYCRKITSLTLPEGLVSLGKGAFCECSGLTSLTLPTTLTSIGEDAFAGCTALTSFVIPTGVTTIGGSAFGGCDGLAEFIVPDNQKAYKSVEGILYSKDGKTLVAYPNAKTATSFAIPSGVTSIAGGAFSGCKTLTSITIPSSVTSIGNAAFYACKWLTSITIPSGIKMIEDKTFSICSGLTSVTIPSHVTKIGNMAFGFCKCLTSIVIPASVDSIENSAFTLCENLTSVTISEGVSFIAPGAFSGCKALTKFSVAAGNSAYTDIDGVLYSKDKKILIAYPCAKAAKYSIPEGTTTIGNSAFMYCSNIINQLTIPASVTQLGDEAFCLTGSLNTIIFKSTTPPLLGNKCFFEYFKNEGRVIYVPQSALADYKSAKGWEDFVISEEGAISKYQVTLKEAGGLQTEIGEANLNTVSELDITGPINGTDVKVIRTMLPLLRKLNLANARIVSGGDSYYQKNMTADNEIGPYMFFNMKYMESIVIPESIKTIGVNAFKECYSIKTIAIPSGVTFIGDGAFSSSGISSLTIPAGVTSIKSNTFSGCGNLTSLILPEGITSIERATFMGCRNLTSVYIPASVTEIKYGAFQACSALSTISLPSGITKIGSQAFGLCSGLTSMTVPQSVTTIEPEAFYSCKKLASIHIPEGVTEIGENAFYQCESLTIVTFPTSLAEFGYSAFKGCSNLKEFKLAKENKTFCVIDGVLFSKDKKVLVGYPGGMGKDYIIPKGVTKIEACAFEYCAKLTSVTIPETVKNIRPFAFANCTSITSITIPKSVTEIGWNAFDNCKSLKEIHVQPLTPPSTGFKCFNNVDLNSCTVYAPKGMQDAYAKAEEWKEFKKILAE